jgi:hypothetical protein
VDDGSLNQAQLEELKCLENKRNEWLKKEEVEWRLKSRALWLQAGDNNTKKIHHYTNHCRNVNTIWEIKMKKESWLVHFEKKRNQSCFFENIFQAPRGCPYSRDFGGSYQVPSLFSEEMNKSLEEEVTESELRHALSSMQNGKSLGPDGYTVEFFKSFYDLLKDDLLLLVRESQREGKIYGPLNATFLCLIPKKQNSEMFEDYRPISCCNVVYKLIAKIIARRLRPLLSEIIGEEQFGFLQNRQIHDAVVIAQEVFHSVKKNNLKETILKLDLSKSYDRVNWTFLRLVLIQLGMSLRTMNWIMGCLQSESFTVLINGSPSRFFRASRGLRQGFPLSPFLFLLIVEALRKMIKEACSNGLLRGIRVSESERVSHLLFVDDVLCSVYGSLSDVSRLKRILDSYCKATGMQINPEKSCIVLNNCSEAETNSFLNIIPT